jgi:hypothetical protein
MMSYLRCPYGWTGDDPGELVDHLGEVFTPADDIGTDGRRHDQVAPDHVRDLSNIPEPETAPRLLCFCGFGTDEAAWFNDHLLAMFTTLDRGWQRRPKARVRRARTRGDGLPPGQPTASLSQAASHDGAAA